jgi:hypothetical protein
LRGRGIGSRVRVRVRVLWGEHLNPQSLKLARHPLRLQHLRLLGMERRMKVILQEDVLRPEARMSLAWRAV